jgi:hemoglobin-like flavoprotein
MSSIRLAQHAGYIFIVRTAMTPSQIDLVQESYKRIIPQATEASRLFYGELFRLAPDLRVLFPDDINRQKEKFTQMIGIIVKNLTYVSNVTEDLVDLGRRHMGYDVAEEDYEAFGEALLRTLDRVLGAEMTQDIQNAWVAAYEMIMRIMQDAATAPRSAENFFARIIRDVMTAHYGVTLRNEASSVRASIADDIKSAKVKLS